MPRPRSSDDPGDLVFTAEDRASGRFTTELRRAAEMGRACNERWHLRRDGTRFWASGLMMPLLDAAGQPHVNRHGPGPLIGFGIPR